MLRSICHQRVPHVCVKWQKVCSGTSLPCNQGRRFVCVCGVAGSAAVTEALWSHRLSAEDARSRAVNIPLCFFWKPTSEFFFDKSFYSIKYHFIVSRVGRTFMQSFFWMFYENRLIPQGWVATAGLHAWCYLCCHMISRTRVNSLKKCVWVCVLVGGNIQSAPPCQATLGRSGSGHASTWNKSIIFHF